MRYLILIILSIIMLSCTPTTSIEKSTNEVNKTTDTKLFVAYKSPFINILVSGNQVEWVKTEHKYNNPISSTPSSQKEVQGNPKTLPQKTIDELNELLKTSRFYDLKTVYGATENQRHYPYYITVRKGNVVKAVTFRSNPDTAKRPAAFKQVEDYLLKLIK